MLRTNSDTDNVQMRTNSYVNSQNNNNDYQVGLLTSTPQQQEEQKYETHQTPTQTKTQTLTNTITNTAAPSIHEGANYIPAQNVIRICALSIVLSTGFALNTIAVLRSMDNPITGHTGVNGKDMWALLYVTSSIWLCALCYGMVFVTFIGIKIKHFAIISVLYFIGACVQVMSLLIGLLIQDNNGYLCWQFELIYALLPFYIIFLIYFFESTTVGIKMLQLTIFSFMLFLTPCLRYFNDVTDEDLPSHYFSVLVALICAWVLILSHMYLFLMHWNSGLFLKTLIITALLYSLFIIIYYGSRIEFDNYTDKYRIYYYYILITALYFIYCGEMFIKVPPKIIKTNVQHLQERESFNVDIEKYDGTLKLQTPANKPAQAYTVRSVLDMATFATADTNTDYLYNSVPRNYNMKFKPNPNEKIESVIKIFPDFKPCNKNKDKYFSEFNIGDMNDEKNMERFKDSITAIVPFYNEGAHEIYATLRSLYYNWDFLKKTQTKYTFTHFNVLVVGDGWFKAAESTKRYLCKLYNCEMDSIADYDKDKNVHNTVILQTKGNQKLCINPFNNGDDKLFLKVTTIIKIDNRKKANSHEWFLGKYGFAEHCKCDFMFFTDAYSTLNHKGLYQMVMHMKEAKNRDVVCCTGRARVYTNKEEMNFKKLVREEFDEKFEKRLRRRKRYNGWWKHGIFDFTDDSGDAYNKNGIQYKIMDGGVDQRFSVGAHLRACQMFEFEALYGTIGCYLLGGFLPVIPGPCGFYRSEYLLKDSVRGWYFDRINEQNDPDNLDLIMGNMKLAEDRILTITSILNCEGSVRHSLIPDCIFYFDPQPNLEQLMKQRRRWINGSIATIIFVLRKVDFAEWRVNWFRKQYVLMLWYMQLAMYVVLYLSPPIIFVLAFHYGLATMLHGLTKMEWETITEVSMYLQIISWALYLLFVYFAMAKNRKFLGCCDLKSISVRLMLGISYTFGIFTVFGSVMQFVDLFEVILRDPKKIFEGKFNAFNFFVMTIETVFFLQSFILAPLFSYDMKTLVILCKTGVWYFLYAPFYVIFFFIYAILNVHDLSWGTRPDKEEEGKGGANNPKHTTYKIMGFLIFSNVVMAIVIQPLMQWFWPRMIFFGVLSLPSVFLIIFSLFYMFTTNLMALLRACKPKRIDDQFRYVFTSASGLESTLNIGHQTGSNGATAKYKKSLNESQTFKLFYNGMQETSTTIN